MRRNIQELSVLDAVYYEDLIATVTEISKKNITIAVYEGEYREWIYLDVLPVQLTPRVRKVVASVFELLDRVWVIEGNTKSLGVITGYENGAYVVSKFTETIWRRFSTTHHFLEHRTEEYDDLLFQVRQENLTQSWLKWTLPNNWKFKKGRWVNG